MSSIFVEPTDWVLEIPQDRQSAVWKQNQAYFTAWGRSNANLNQLCLETILSWLQIEYFPTATAWLSASMLPMVWEVVNGAVIRIGTKRIAIFPTEAIDLSEVEVPQEWVDIPSWAADYYLGVQVSIDDRELYIYGYATHQQLRASGVYDPQDRTYCLAIEDTNPDLNGLWLTLERDPAAATRATIPPIPSLTNDRIAPLLDRLSNPAELLPRLAVPFAVWAAILTQPGLHQQFYQQRLTGQSSPIVTRLTDWLQHRIDPVWQALELVLLPQQLEIAVRSVDRVLQPQSDIYRAKVYNLDAGQIALIVGITAIDDTESRIEVQIYPGGGATQLPDPTRLRLLTTDGTEIGQASAAVTETIHFQFRVSAGEGFQVEIACAGQIWIESLTG